MTSLRTGTTLLAAAALVAGGGTAALAASPPRITEIEVDDAAGDRLRLEAEVVPRGARVTSVRFTYRGRTCRAQRVRGNHWARTVAARGGDGDDRVITLRVRACAGESCVSRTGRDEA